METERKDKYPTRLRLGYGGQAKEHPTPKIEGCRSGLLPVAECRTRLGGQISRLGRLGGLARNDDVGQSSPNPFSHNPLPPLL